MDVHGLRGGRHVGSAAPIDDAPRVMLGMGYAYTEGVIDGTDRHHRLFGELAAAWAPWRYLQLSLGFDARYDRHSTELGENRMDRGGALGTRIDTRHAFAINDRLSLAGRTALRFPPAAKAGYGFKGVSPEFGAIATYQFAPAYELSVDVGYRHDRSLETVDTIENLRDGDRLAASISRFDAALVGALFAMPIGPVTASAEWSWDVFVGQGAPSALASPMRVRLAAQTRLAQRYLPGVEVGVSPSARPDLERLARIEPRFWFALTLGVSFERLADEVQETAPKTAPPQQAAPEPARLELTVRDPNGEPVRDAKLELALDDARETGSTDAEGRGSFALRADREHTLSVSADGFSPYSAAIQGKAGTQLEEITLQRALPEGEIKGRVRSLRGGQPVHAKISVSSGQTLDTNAKGEFVLSVPPGQYTLEISAAGYEPQTRSAHVERLGVTILVVDLRKATK